MKYGVARHPSNESEYIMQSILSCEGLILINVNQFIRNGNNLQGNITLIVLSVLLFCTIMFNNYSQRWDSGSLKPLS